MPSSEVTAVRCEHLVAVYESATGRVQAVRGVDLDIMAGVTTAVVGPSGSGKSSLLRMIAGLDVPTAGLVEVNGINLSSQRPGQRARLRGRLLTHVYQRPADNLLGHLTARQQLRRLAAPRSMAQARTADALDRLGLTHRAEHLPGAMSGGEQQRLAFARAMVAGHAVVIADEPTAELDRSSANAVLDAIDVLASEGVTVLVATHDQMVMDRAAQVVTLRDGAVASITIAGTELAVIDGSGRLQLPPEVRDRFPLHRAHLVWDDEADRLVVEPS